MPFERKIDVIKLDVEGVETWRYTGIVIKRSENWIILEALFDRSDVELFGLSLARGDRFIEIYFRNRWFNIFEIYDQGSQIKKGWYCNIAMPAEISANHVSYIDLAIDLLVFPDNKQLILDMEEFEALKIDQIKRKTAVAALTELRSLFDNHPNFDMLNWVENLNSYS